MSIIAPDIVIHYEFRLKCYQARNGDICVIATMENIKFLVECVIVCVRRIVKNESCSKFPSLFVVFFCVRGGGGGGGGQ